MKESTSDYIIGHFISRPNRFLGKVRIQDREVDVFVPNPGRMNELLNPGKTVYLRKAAAKHRKTDYDMVAVKHEDLIVSIDSNLPNRFMKKKLETHQLPFINNYTSIKPEPSMYNGRFDFLLDGESGRTVIEVKSCTLVEQGHTLFPDAPTKRGARHMLHLVKALSDGLVENAMVVFVIQRPDAELFSPNDPMDPNFGDALRYAYENGVEVFAIRTKLVDWELQYLGIVPVRLYHFK
ncbi:MAG: DNA/RNA nuclease SfsA [Candidatus Lokiarchaeota archaeon]|nr:DNA/RNA nuclease SfsA [Candidatus Lokiarchaeota archaeon]